MGGWNVKIVLQLLVLSMKKIANAIV